MPYKDPEVRRAKARIYAKRYAQSEHGREARRRANRAHYHRNPPRVEGPKLAAKRAVAKAVGAGELKPVGCIICSRKPTQAHHYLGYAVEHRLDVAWLCSEHHVEAHTRLRGGVNARDARRVTQR